jgi:uncharacterized membrane protein SirB2
MAQPSNRGTDFFIVTAATLTLCTVLMVGLPWLMPRAWGDRAAVTLSIGLGVIALARRHGKRSLPVIAVYVPAMIIFVMLVALQVAWLEGGVEL